MIQDATRWARFSLPRRPQRPRASRRPKDPRKSKGPRCGGGRSSAPGPSSLCALQYDKDLPQLVQRATRVAGDVAEHRPCCRADLRMHERGAFGPYSDEGHMVGDDVVQVTGDACSLAGNRSHLQCELGLFGRSDRVVKEAAASAAERTPNAY